MPVISGGPKSGRRSTATEGRRTVFGSIWRGTRWVVGGPVAVFPTAQIIKSARFIGFLAELLGRRPVRDGRLHLTDDRTIDLTATAFASGLTAADLEGHLAGRCRETARAAYFALGLGWVFFLLWLIRMATVPLTAVDVVPALEFLPFCLAFFLMAFRSALQNYQIRTRTLATAVEYLQTSSGFWPRESDRHRRPAIDPL